MFSVPSPDQRIGFLNITKGSTLIDDFALRKLSSQATSDFAGDDDRARAGKVLLLNGRGGLAGEHAAS